MTPNEISRLAAAAHALRPDWPVESVRTYLTATHGHRPYRDAATALAWVATDPATRTPKRLEEAGPWWHVGTVEADRRPTPPPFQRGPVPADQAEINTRAIAALRATARAAVAAARASCGAPKEAP